jgi:hypothetical protein
MLLDIALMSPEPDATKAEPYFEHALQHGRSDGAQQSKKAYFISACISRALVGRWGTFPAFFMRQALDSTKGK